MAYADSNAFEAAMREHIAINEEEVARMGLIESTGNFIGPLVAAEGVDPDTFVGTPYYIPADTADRPWDAREERSRGQIMYKAGERLGGWTIHEATYGSGDEERLAPYGDVTERVVLMGSGTVLVARSKLRLEPTTELTIPKPILRGYRDGNYGFIEPVYRETHIHAVIKPESHSELVGGTLLGPKTTLDNVVDGLMRFTVKNELDQHFRRRS